MLYFSVSIHKNEIFKSIDARLTYDAVFFLILSLQLESISHSFDHRDFSPASVSLRSVDAEIGSKLIPVIVVNQSVIHADKARVKIYVPPAEPCQFSNSHACIEQDIEDRIPVVIPLSIKKELQKQVLLCFTQCFPLLNLMPVCDLEFFQHFITGIGTDIVVIHGNLKHLVKNVVNVVDSRDFQVLYVTEIIIEPL